MTNLGALESELRASVDGEVRFDAGTRAAYSTDGSNFRQVPLGVVVPHNVDATVAAVEVCRRHEAPLLSRGGGTSLAGQCTNTAVVIDWTKYCNALVSVDADSSRCVVEPGIVLDELNRRLAPHDLRFGPEPATHPNCTLGGMMGNNSCGATAQRTGKVVDNVTALEVLLYDGTRFWCGPTSDDEYATIVKEGGQRAEIYRQLRSIRDEYADDIRSGYPQIPRRVSGYNLDSLLPEQGFNIAGALIGSESTLVTILRAELRLVPVVKFRALVVLGYPSSAAAGAAAAGVAAHGPIALEGVDERLVTDEQIKHLHQLALDQLPKGDAWLLVQFGGDTQQEADDAAQRLLDAVGKDENGPDAQLLDDPEREDQLWTVREAGLGATAHVPGHRDTWEGWEDSAVPPERLGDYLRDLERLYEEFGYAEDTAPSLYGHFGQGCVHTRIPFDLYDVDGVTQYRRFLDRAADLVVSYGGSLSGEHGDGQTRGALLSKMFGDRLMDAFSGFKAVFDPSNQMNPGKVVHPRSPDVNLRLGGDWTPVAVGRLQFGYPQDGGSFAQAADRCVGVGKCRQLTTDGGAVMCPSYQVTREEEHSTRGRARLLFEMLNGHGDGPIQDGWRSTVVRDALDLCLACKGCKSDCPVNVDMATYKAEFLSHHWHRRIRPRSHYTLGWLPLMARGVHAARVPRVVNALATRPAVRRVATRAGGVEDRELPRFAGETFQRWASRRAGADGAAGQGSGRGEVLVWPDTFTNHFHPQIGQAAVEVLESAGWRVTVPSEPLCCGLTWISTGQLATARRVLRRTLDRLVEHVRQGGYVVGLEPSCTAVFRSDSPELFAGDVAARRVADRTVTFAELLTQHTPGWDPPRPNGPTRNALVQVHCHQHAVLGWDADQQLLESMGVDAEHLDSGCCGLAGNFGFEPGHAEVSKACAERVLLPRLREADDETLVLADGFSCRTQIHELDSAGKEAVHLAELVRANL